MPKETYYFSHDYNARNDRKIAALVKKYKSSGYGIFWATCEMMHEEGGHLEMDDLTFDSIAKDLSESSELVKQVLESCISEFKLFQKDEDLLKSNRVSRNFDDRNEKKRVKSEAGRIGGINSGISRGKEKIMKQNEAVLQAASSNEANKGNKGKEIKEIKDVLNGNHHPEMTDKEFKAFSSKLKTDQLFLEPMFSNGLPKEFLEKWILRFHIHIAGEGKLNKDYSEYRKHFKNWIFKQDYLNPPPSISPLEKIKSSAAYIKAEKDVDFDKYRK